MMSYLLFFRSVELFGLSTPPGHTNMLQMILTLKIIGLAFERNSVLTKARDDKTKSQLTPAEIAIRNIGVVDMFHYCFNYIGLLTGA
jgi:lysophospholipid acyltransferase 7